MSSEMRMQMRIQMQMQQESHYCTQVMFILAAFKSGTHIEADVAKEAGSHAEVDPFQQVLPLQPAKDAARTQRKRPRAIGRD